MPSAEQFHTPTTDDAWDTVDDANETHAVPHSDPVKAAEQAQGSVAAETSANQVVAFFADHGLAKYAKQLVSATDAETVDDLRLLDDSMVEALVATVGLKLITAEKLRVCLRGLSSGESSGCPPIVAGQSAASVDSSGGTASDVSAKPTPPAPAAAKLEECIAICIDRSGSMGTPFAELTINEVKGSERQPVQQRTRMEAVKAMFYAFRDRLESVSHNGSHRLGLLQYDSEVEELLGLSEKLDAFERVVDDMQKRGTTAIYSSIVEAARMLTPVFRASPDADLRVLVLTDGQNNSGAAPQTALRAANEIGAVVDAIIVGSSPDADLRRIVAATGGQCFQIQDLGAGFELLEAEAVVSLRARRGGAGKPPFTPREAVDDAMFGQIAQVEVSAGAGVPYHLRATPQKPPPRVTSIGSIAMAKVSASASSATAKRALKELRALASGSSDAWLHTGEGVHVFPSEADLTFWRALLEGPAGSPFEGGLFALTVRLPHDYPFKPPLIAFETPVYHCNMSDSGSVCLDLLKERWSPALSVPRCLEAIRMLLAKPDPDNALRQWIAELTQAHLTHGDADTRYVEAARAHTAKHASRSRAEWESEWSSAANV